MYVAQSLETTHVRVWLLVQRLFTRQFFQDTYAIQLFIYANAT